MKWKQGLPTYTTEPLWDYSWFHLLLKILLHKWATPSTESLDPPLSWSILSLYSSRCHDILLLVNKLTLLITVLYNSLIVYINSTHCIRSPPSLRGFIKWSICFFHNMATSPYPRLPHILGFLTSMSSGSHILTLLSKQWWLNCSTFDLQSNELWSYAF
jgi:hypothetical protein